MVKFEWLTKDDIYIHSLGQWQQGKERERSAGSPWENWDWTYLLSNDKSLFFNEFIYFGYKHCVTIVPVLHASLSTSGYLALYMNNTHIKGMHISFFIELSIKQWLTSSALQCFSLSSPWCWIKINSGFPPGPMSQRLCRETYAICYGNGWFFPGNRAKLGEEAGQGWLKSQRCCQISVFLTLYVWKVLFSFFFHWLQEPRGVSSGCILTHMVLLLLRGGTCGIVRVCKQVGGVKEESTKQKNPTTLQMFHSVAIKSKSRRLVSATDCAMHQLKEIWSCHWGKMCNI